MESLVFAVEDECGELKTSDAAELKIILTLKLGKLVPVSRVTELIVH